MGRHRAVALPGFCAAEQSDGGAGVGTRRKVLRLPLAASDLSLEAATSKGRLAPLNCASSELLLNVVYG